MWRDPSSRAIVDIAQCEKCTGLLQRSVAATEKRIVNMTAFVRSIRTSLLLLATLAGVLAVNATSASAQVDQPGNPVLCTTIQDADGTFRFGVTLGEGFRYPLFVRQVTSNGSKWIATVREGEFGTPEEFPQGLEDGDGYFIRYRVRGVVNDTPCFNGDLPSPPQCSIQPWSVGSDPFWSVVVEPNGVNDLTLFINGEEISSNDTPYTDGGGNQNVWFDIARVATPQLDIAIAPTAAKFRQESCGSVQENQVKPGACDVTPSQNNPGRVWIELDVDFPVNFTVQRNGVDVGEPTPIKFADFPGSFLEPNDFYAVPGSTSDTYVLRFEDNTGLVCTGIVDPPPPVDSFSCTQTGSTLTWTDQGADNGLYHIRLDQGSTTKWESTVAGLSGTIDRPNSRYLIRWREAGRVMGRFCS